ncbi:glycolate oxidase subunits GlcE [Stappia aggregata IAM 12614]|uniref:Glycolate oxidase subunits GlcE n=1 Tax=Roseibium aggregatum (strain ATCC 25650 / DSM 13394 / JCM 20685 / NBRC 16684 / NCIMB 2208 / IAM 12614 / B1) TaxID=384765 RepID=A0NUZ4_ROSAI|nr:glycolate oxidase subunit GlcE [Roseibium aggregatum]EAV43261.1 glycolate oxidase subunits GlcE [Stappia aggregata IAM 12614] [Roseibium aggregatum IAM 12614]
MDATLKPQSTGDVEKVVAWAAAEDQPLEIIGQGSKRALGRPVQAAHVLDLSGLTGIESYEPAELVLTVKAGTPIAEVEKLVDDNGQELSFEPMDFGPLLGCAPAQGTIGGVLAANLSGPRRIKAGAARDHVLGMEAVSGRGEVFNSGGKVVKNVTGYDLPRALCGSYGTLAVATTVTLKVNPKPETSATFMLSGLDDDDGIKALCQAMGSSAEISGAAHLPAGVNGGSSSTLLRLEGFSTSVDYRFRTLQTLLASYGAPSRLEAVETGSLWQTIRDVKPYADGTTPVWRISVAPTAGPQLVAGLRETFELQAYYDWSGGLVWLSCLDGALHEADIRAAIDAVGGGHATLVRADASQRANASVFHPQPGPLAALSRRLKEQFDPKGILNPGKMVSGV